MCVCVVALCSLLRCVRLDVCGTTQLVRGLCSSLIVLQTNASAWPSARARSLVGFASDSGTVALWLLLLLHAEIVDMSTSVAERAVTVVAVVVVPIVVVQGQQLKQTALRPCHPCHIILAEKEHLKSANEPQNIDTWLSRNRSLSLTLSPPPSLACLPSSQAVADTLTH